MKKITAIIVLTILGRVAIAQPSQRIALTNLEQAKVVESSKAGQIPLTNTDGNLRYAQYTEVDLNPLAFTPASTGNTSNYSEFVTAPNGDVYYIDWQGRAILLNSSASADLWSEEYFSNITGNTITATGPLPNTNTARRIVVYRTGVKLREGVDYAVSANTITLVVGGLSEAFTIRYR